MLGMVVYCYDGLKVSSQDSDAGRKYGVLDHPQRSSAKPFRSQKKGKNFSKKKEVRYDAPTANASRSSKTDSSLKTHYTLF